MKSKSSLFKNDPFGIKRKILHYKIEKCIKDEINIRTKYMARLLGLVNKIGIPRTDEETELIRKYIKKYDELVLELDENLKYARMYIEEGNQK